MEAPVEGREEVGECPGIRGRGSVGFELLGNPNGGREAVGVPPVKPAERALWK